MHAQGGTLRDLADYSPTKLELNCISEITVLYLEVQPSQSRANSLNTPCIQMRSQKGYYLVQLLQNCLTNLQKDQANKIIHDAHDIITRNSKKQENVTHKNIKKQNKKPNLTINTEGNI